MPTQIVDSFRWNHEDWALAEASDVYALFSPVAYGLRPTAPYAACQKGFVVHLAVRDGHLYLTSLQVYCADGVYPPINGAEAIPGDSGMMLYDGIDVALPYTGRIIVGRDPLPQFQGRTFLSPRSYAVTYELSFSDGTLADVRETSAKRHFVR